MSVGPMIARSETILRPWLAIIGLAALLTFAAAVQAPRLNDSYWIDWVWLDQFAKILRAGTLYPRWLPLSHGGLGSPVFYYYPPLAFYLGSVFVMAGLNVYAALIATFFAGYVAAGTGMYLWLKSEARWALAGALIYVAAPYHACNFYLRGAVAEFTATAVLPFVMLGLRRLGAGKRDAFALVALGYAALIYSHLPLALLASLFLIGPYALVLCRTRPPSTAYVIGALATGVALAGAYLVPAFALEPYRDAAKLWELPVLQPHNWTFWNRAVPNGYPSMLIIGAALAFPLLLLTLVDRSRWAAFGLLYVALGIGLVPVIWEMPLIRSVQFPFRILPLAEFALATGIARSNSRPLLVGLLCLPALFITWSIVVRPATAAQVTMNDLQTLHPDVPENLPPGDRPYSWPSRWALELAKEHQAQQVVNGLTIEPVFFFPAWRETCAKVGVRTFADERTKLLSHRGDHCVRHLRLTVQEEIGAAVSFLGLLALAWAWIGKARGLPRRTLARKGGAEGMTA